MIHEAFTTHSALYALTGGGLIGGLAASRLKGQNKILPSSTPVPFVTFGVVLGGFLFAHVIGLAGFEAAGEGLGFTRVAIAGSLVGAGAQLGQGCTCGNGIQGLSALSKASFVFVVVFMAAGVGSASFLESAKTLGHTELPDGDEPPPLFLLVVALLGIVAQLAGGRLPVVAVDLLAGIGFAAALTISTMVKPSKVVHFLDILGVEGWDPSLALVMGGALAVCLPCYQLLKLNRGPITKWTGRKLDTAHVIGGLCFGVGWGLCGLCPGPALVNCGVLSPQALTFVVAMFGTRRLFEAL